MYEAEISRANPACIVFLIDQSSSMRAAMPSTTQSKQMAVADAINSMLRELLIRCGRGIDEIWDFFHVCVIGYGATVGPALGGPLSGRDLVPASALAQGRLRNERLTRTEMLPDGTTTTHVAELPVWLEAAAAAGTPMCEALRYAHGVLDRWVTDHPGSFPPIVLNLTDGESTDGDPAGPAQQLRSIRTDDGSALLFNLHISSDVATPTQFPSTGTGLPPMGAKLFSISDVLPPDMRDTAMDLGMKVEQGARGFVFNASMQSVMLFLNVGTPA
ncbi:vWA domain-containing protein [Streptomyces sp. NPDC021056]|uniref:vWA domain-containing protein n=1 Tax=Streptomyces sp. NPDC021056 TaxID=3155012 RepID=UPI0033D457C8